MQYFQDITKGAVKESINVDKMFEFVQGQSSIEDKAAKFRNSNKVAFKVEEEEDKNSKSDDEIICFTCNKS